MQYWTLRLVSLLVMAMTHQGISAERLPPSYDQEPPWPPQIVEQPILPCPQSSCEQRQDIEVGLEEEFWDRVQVTDTDGMPKLIGKIKKWIKSTETPYAARLNKLIAFAQLMMARSVPIQNSKFLKYSLEGLGHGKLASHLDPDDTTGLIFNWFGNAMVGYMFSPKAGDHFVRKLEAMPNTHGLWGLEGKLVAQYALANLKDPHKVAQALQTMGDCTQQLCTLTSSIAPFKMMGNFLTMGEAQAYLGRQADFEETYQRGLGWATEHQFPKELLTLWQEAYQGIQKPGGLIDQWRSQKIPVGVRLPFADSVGTKGCVFCHAGNQVPRHYYQ